jgi:hypothetical protein
MHRLMASWYRHFAICVRVTHMITKAWHARHIASYGGSSELRAGIVGVIAMPRCWAVSGC